MRCPDVPPGPTWVWVAVMKTFDSLYLPPNFSRSRRSTSNWIDWNISPISAMTKTLLTPSESSKMKARANWRKRIPVVDCFITAYPFMPAPSGSPVMSAMPRPTVSRASCPFARGTPIAAVAATRLAPDKNVRRLNRIFSVTELTLFPMAETVQRTPIYFWLLNYFS